MESIWKFILQNAKSMLNQGVKKVGLETRIRALNFSFTEDGESTKIPNQLVWRKFKKRLCPVFIPHIVNQMSWIFWYISVKQISL